jgi:hypothetical protein
LPRRAYAYLRMFGRRALAETDFIHHSTGGLE